MGLTYSTPQTDRAKVNKIENVTKLAELNLNESDDLLDSLNITEFNRVNIKEPLPIIGGQYSDFNHYDQDDETEEETLSRNTRFIPSKNRFNKYDLFKVINELENKKKLNRNLKGGNVEEELTKSLSDNDAMEQVQKIILQELDKVSNRNMTGGGDCGCNGSKNNLEGGKKKSVKKNQKKTKKTLSSEDSLSEKIKLNSSEGSNTETETDSESESESSSSIKQSSNGESEDNGLSIFPMNSSDVNNSSSERNSRMLRRRI
jgi:hypothetical protein